MKISEYKIVNDKLVCFYETYTGKKGIKEFSLIKKEKSFLPDGILKDNNVYSFRDDNTKYRLNHVQWCNLNNCYVALYNNTKFSSFIKCDLNEL